MWWGGHACRQKSCYHRLIPSAAIIIYAPLPDDIVATDLEEEGTTRFLYDCSAPNATLDDMTTFDPSEWWRGEMAAAHGDELQVLSGWRYWPWESDWDWGLIVEG